MPDDTDMNEENTVEAPDVAPDEVAEEAPDVVADEVAPDPEADAPPLDGEPLRRRFPLALRVTVAGVLAVGLAIALVLAPYPVLVDSTLRFIPRGAKVSDLAKRGLLTATRGDLLSAGGGVARAGAGGEPVVTSGIETLGRDSAVPFLARLTSSRGADVKEDVVTEVILTGPSTTYIGTGTVESVASAGTTGTTRVTMGAVSKHVVAREVITEATPRVILLGVVPRGAKYIALTFDDGPWPGQTEKVLDILASRGAKATFFLLGRSISRSPALAKRVADSGNEVGTHSLSHKLLARASNATVMAEIRYGAQVLKRVTGTTPYWYRPAGGSVNPYVYKVAKSLKLQLILWDLDTHDYRKPGTAKLVKYVVSNAKNGTVVLMHDGGGNRSQTIAALPAIIDALHAKGFLFVTLTELYDRPNPPKMRVHP